MKYQIEQFVEDGERDFSKKELKDMEFFARKELKLLKNKPDTYIDIDWEEWKNDKSFEVLLKDFLIDYEIFKKQNDIQKWKIIQDSSKQKESLSKEIKANLENRTDIKEIQWDGYIVKKNDWLSIVTKGINITFNNEADKIWPGDKITLEKNILYRTHNNKKVRVWVWEDYKEEVKPVIVKKEEIVPISNSTPDSLPTQVPTPDAVLTPVPDSIQVQDNKTEENIETLDTVSDYFKIEIITLTEQLEKNWLNLDLVNFLTTYKKYIDTNLVWLNNDILEKIKKSIWLRILELSNIVTERIAWVDEQIEENDYKKEDRKKEIQNQRWIINGELNDLFLEVNNKILPSAMVLAKKVNTKALDEDLEISKMFEAELTDDGEFDKTWRSGEVYDAATNSWSVIDSNDEKHAGFLKNNSIETIEWANLLSKKDTEIESDATIAYFIYVGSMLIPYAWMLTAIPADAVDLLSDEEWVTTILRKTSIIDENYRMEKWYIDTILWWASIALSIFWLQWIAKWKKIVKAGSMLDKMKIWVLEDKMQSIWNKMWISKENIDKILGLVKKTKTWTKTDEIVEWAFSTPVTFYKNSKTWATYTKTLDWKFINSKWQELKGKPKNIEKVKTEEVKPKNNSTKTEKIEDIKTFEKIKDFLTKTSETKLIKYFSELKWWEVFKNLPQPSKKATIAFLQSMAISWTLSVAIHEYSTEWKEWTSPIDRLKESALAFGAGALIWWTFIVAVKWIYSSRIISKWWLKVIYQWIIKPPVWLILRNKVPIWLTGFAWYVWYNAIKTP